MGQKQFLSQSVSDEIKDPRIFCHFMDMGAEWAVSWDGMHRRLSSPGCSQPHSLSCSCLCVQNSRNLLKVFPAQLFQTQFHLLSCPFSCSLSCSQYHILWAVPLLLATHSQFPTGHHLHLPSCWRCGTS